MAVHISVNRIFSQGPRPRPALGGARVLGTDADGPPEWLAAGQALERVLLRACSHGFTGSFLNQPVEVEPLRPRLAVAIGRSDAFPQLVLRLGGGPEIPHTPRERVDNVLVESSAHG